MERKARERGAANRASRALGAVGLAAVVMMLTALMTGGLALASAESAADVVVPKRQPVQIAVVLDTTEPLASLFTEGIRNAIDMAVSEHPSVRGFSVQLNTFAGPCFPTDALALNADAAQAAVSNAQTVAVIGHMCSFAFANVPGYDGDCVPSTIDSSPSALAIYEANDVVTINGSTTNPCLPAVGPRVFNGLFVPDNLDYNAWYSAVQALPNDVAWHAAYTARFGKPATEFADLYYDATTLLIKRLTQTAKVKNGALTIDRAALATAVRNTKNYCGATGNITIDSSGFRTYDPRSC